MKKIELLLVMLLAGFFSFAQIPSAQVENLKGEKVNTSELSNDGKVMVISFWATWCKPCVKELSAIADVYEDWQEETGVKLVAVSIDNARSKSRVAPFINSQGWEYEILLDPNGDFKRVMNVVNVPHTFVLDGNGKIIYQHTSFADGDEEELFRIIEEATKSSKK